MPPSPRKTGTSQTADSGRNQVRTLRLSTALAPLRGRTSEGIRPPASSPALRSAGRPVHPFVPRRIATAIPDPLRPVPRPFERVRHTALPHPPESVSDTTLRPSQVGRSGKEPRVRQPKPDSSSNQYYAERFPQLKRGRWPRQSRLINLLLIRKAKRSPGKSLQTPLVDRF